MAVPNSTWTKLALSETGKTLHKFMEKKMAKFPKDLALVFALSFLKLLPTPKQTRLSWL